MEQLISRLISMGLFKYLGIGSVGLFIWFTGPYVEPLRPAINRIILIVAVVVLYGIYLLVRKLFSKRKEKKLSDDLAASAESEADPSRERSDEELATLKEKFDDALQVLRKSGKGKYRSGSLYALPWYMIIGPPGAGKTTLLVNSGLQFPLAEKMGLSKLQGVGGTRFCDWWFTDEAVIVDTAGRYTTQDSDEQVDNAAWIGFLKMLRKNRKRRPINGIIVAISIDELARQSEVDRERSATAVTQRVQELYDLLGVRFPVYVMFTKCDLMAGFMEYFGDLDRHQREQVWGATFPVTSNALELLDDEMDLLQQQLQERLVRRLQQERDPQRRNLIYNFPGLFNSARPLVTDFMTRVFKPSRYTTTPFLRGIYFTSGTQEGTPFNRLISQLARNFSLSAAAAYAGPTQGKSFFIKDLLGKVIFGESGLAGANLKAERIFGLLRNGGLAALAIVPLVLIGLWWWSAVNNRAMMDTLGGEAVGVDEQIAAVNPASSLLSILPLLNETRDLTTGYAAQSEPVPIRMTFGLYQGDRLARNLTIPAYRTVLENAFLSRLMVRLEQLLKANLNNPEVAYQVLKAYLMLDNDERLEPEYVKRIITQDWDQTFGQSLSKEQQGQLVGHLDALLDLRPFTTPFPPDSNLVEHARAVLEQTSPAQRAYAMIKSELISRGEEFTVISAGGPEAGFALIRVSGEPLNRGVPAMFSPAGYVQEFLPTQQRVIGEQEDEFWIFGTDATGSAAFDSDQLSNLVSKLYYEDYIATWWRFLEDVRIRSFRDFVDAAELLDVLTGADSPLVLLLTGAAKNTNLVPDVGLEGGTDKEDSLFSAVGELFGSDGERISAVADPSVVDRSFESLNDFVTPGDNQPSPIEGIMKDLHELYVYISILAERGTGSATIDAQLQLGREVDRLKFAARRAPEPVGDWIAEVAENAETIVVRKEVGDLNARWQSEVASFCRRAIENRYPFAADSLEEVRLQDFGQFFGPGGKMDQFFQNNLASLVNTSTSPWSLQAGAGRVRVSPQALRMMQLAREIQLAFFSRPGPLPSTSFDLKPMRMDPKTTHFMLNIDGQRINYSHGPLLSTSIDWPSASTFSQVQIQFSPETAIGGSRTETGEWAWFRMLDNSTIEPAVGLEQYKLTFTLDDRWITYELRPRSAFNPFNLSHLRSFRCVPNL